ncbi:unnamed protein product [Malus baccata var. baccata]
MVFLGERRELERGDGEWIVIKQMNLLQPKLKGGLLRRTGEIAPLSQTNQIDEAINYIKSQESKLQKLKEKKESLMRTRKRSYATACVNVEGTRSAKARQIKIHEIDSTLEIGKSMSEFGAARITEKLNRFVNGSTSDQESQQEYF